MKKAFISDWVVLFLSFLGGQLFVLASDYQWDPNGTEPGLGGAGSWNLKVEQWDLLHEGKDDGTDPCVKFPNDENDTYYFSGEGGVVSFDGTYQNRGRTIFTTGGYQFSPGVNRDFIFHKLVRLEKGKTIFVGGGGGNGDFKFNGGLEILSGASAKVGVRGNPQNAVTTYGHLIGAGDLEMYGSNKHQISGDNVSFTGTVVPNVKIELKSAGALRNATLFFDADSKFPVIFDPTIETCFIGALAGTNNLDLGSIRLDCGGNNLDTYFAGSFIGNGQIVKSGTGKWTLAGASTSYTGSFVLNGGTVKMGARDSIGNGGGLEINQGTLVFPNEYTCLNRSVVKLGAGTLRMKLNPNGSGDVLSPSLLTGPSKGESFHFIFNFPEEGNQVKAKYEIVKSGVPVDFPVDRLTAEVEQQAFTPEHVQFMVKDSSLFVVFTGPHFVSSTIWNKAENAGNWNKTEANWKVGSETGALFEDGSNVEFSNLSVEGVTITVTEPVTVQLMLLSAGTTVYHFQKGEEGSFEGEQLVCKSGTTNIFDTSLLNSFTGDLSLKAGAELSLKGSDALSAKVVSLGYRSEMVVSPVFLIQNGISSIQLDYLSEQDIPELTSRRIRIFRLSGEGDLAAVDEALARMTVTLKGPWGENECVPQVLKREGAEVYVLFSGTAYAEHTTLCWGPDGQGRTGWLFDNKWFDPFLNKNDLPISYGNTLVFEGAQSNTFTVTVPPYEYEQKIQIASGNYIFKDGNPNQDVNFNSPISIDKDTVVTFGEKAIGFWDFKFNGGLYLEGKMILHSGDGGGSDSFISSLSGDGELTTIAGGWNEKNTKRAIKISGNNQDFVGRLNVATNNLMISSANAVSCALVDLQTEGIICFSLNNSTYEIGGLMGEGVMDIRNNTVEIGAISSNTVFSGTITGSGGVQKVGTGLLELTGTNTFTGPFTLSEGTVIAGSTDALGKGIFHLQGPSTLEVRLSAVPLAVKVGIMSSPLVLSVDGEGQRGTSGVYKLMGMDAQSQLDINAIELQMKGFSGKETGELSIRENGIYLSVYQLGTLLLLN